MGGLHPSSITLLLLEVVSVFTPVADDEEELGVLGTTIGVVEVSEEEEGSVSVGVVVDVPECSVVGFVGGYWGLADDTSSEIPKISETAKFY